MTRPLRYFVSYLPMERQNKMIADHGESWLDHDPEWHIVERDFATLPAARKFATSDAVSDIFVEVCERTNMRPHEAGAIYGWEWDVKVVDD